MANLLPSLSSDDENGTNFADDVDEDEDEDEEVNVDFGGLVSLEYQLTRSIKPE